MEIKGDEFIKKVKIRQEKEDIQKRLQELEDQDPLAPSFDEQLVNNNAYEEQVVKNESELDDIMLQTPAPSNNENNKKKYIVLGLLLIVLFLLTVIVFRLLTNPEQSEFNQDQNGIPQDKALNGDNIEQQYQKIINEKLQDIKEANTQPTPAPKKPSMELKEIEKVEAKLPKPAPKKEEIKKTEQLKEDIFGIKEENNKAASQPVKKPVIKTTVEKKVYEPVKKPAPKKVASSTTSAPKGIFIQLTAVTKALDPKYTQNLEKNGVPYVIYKEEVKGKIYTKVLAGPYKSKTEAKNSKAVKLLNLKNPYIRSF